MPRFTVLVAVYNAEAWLPQCLDSLLGQTEQSLEVICIDDCSTDGSADVVRRYMAHDDRVSLLRTSHNSGQAVARNLGLEQARGELTTMVDADDWLAPDSLERMWKAFCAEPDNDAVVFRLVYWQEGRTWYHDRTEALPRSLTGRDACRYSIDWTLHGCYAVRTELHRRFPYDTSCRLFSDDNTSRQHYLHCRHVALSDACYYYRQHPGNSTRQATRRSFDFIAANNSLRAMLEHEGADADMLSICEDYVWRNYVGLWRKWQKASSLSAEEEEEVAALFRRAYAMVRTSRLPWHTRLRPCFFKFATYSIFALWQRLLTLRQ